MELKSNPQQRQPRPVPRPLKLVGLLFPLALVLFWPFDILTAPWFAAAFFASVAVVAVEIWRYPELFNRDTNPTRPKKEPATTGKGITI